MSVDPRILQLSLFAAHKGSVLCADVSRDGRFFASGGEDGIVAIYRTSDGAVVRAQKLNSPVTSVCLTPTGSCAIAGHRSGALRCIATATGAATPLPALTGEVTCMAVGAPDGGAGPCFAAGTTAGVVRVFRSSVLEPTSGGDWSEVVGYAHRSEDGGAAAVTAMEFSPRSVWLVSGDNCGRVVIYTINDADGVGMYREILHKPPISCLTVHDTMRLVAVGSGDRCVRVWDLCSRNRSANRQVGKSGFESTGHEAVRAVLCDAATTPGAPQVLLLFSRGGRLRSWSYTPETAGEDDRILLDTLSCPWGMPLAVRLVGRRLFIAATTGGGALGLYAVDTADLALRRSQAQVQVQARPAPRPGPPMAASTAPQAVRAGAAGRAGAGAGAGAGSSTRLIAELQRRANVFQTAVRHWQRGDAAGSLRSVLAHGTAQDVGIWVEHARMTEYTMEQATSMTSDLVLLVASASDLATVSQRAAAVALVARFAEQFAQVAADAMLNNSQEPAARQRLQRARDFASAVEQFVEAVPVDAPGPIRAEAAVLRREASKMNFR